MIRSRLTGQPAVPATVADEIELYAREWGRHARTRWDPEMGCFASSLTLRPGDPMLRAWQEGRLKQAEPPTETVLWWDWDAQAPMDLEQFGPSGVRRMLEQGNTFSGRGEYGSLQEAVDANHRKYVAAQETAYRVGLESARDRGQDQRRRILKIPLVPVGIELKTG